MPMFRPKTLQELKNDNLLFAIMDGDLKKFKLALESGANPSHIVCGELPIKTAISEGQVEMLEILINDPRVILTLEDLCTAVEHDQSSVVSILLKHIDPSGDNQGVIFSAATNNSVKSIPVLLADRRVNLKHNDFEAIKEAAEMFSSEAFELLIEHEFPLGRKAMPRELRNNSDVKYMLKMLVNEQVKRLHKYRATALKLSRTGNDYQIAKQVMPFCFSSKEYLGFDKMIKDGKENVRLSKCSPSKRIRLT